jgi:hypothetical protein
MTKLYWHLALAGLLAFGALAVSIVLAISGAYVFVNIMPLVFFAAAVGSVVNNYHRLAKLSEVDKAVAAQIENSVFTLQIYVSLLISGILGLVMYGLCMTSLLGGELFPQFIGTEAGYQTMSSFLNEVKPKANLDIGKMLIWAFVAGFSERLIPNVLDRLARQAEALRGEPPPGP